MWSRRGLARHRGRVVVVVCEREEKESHIQGEKEEKEGDGRL